MSKGGADDSSNFVALCEVCHGVKCSREARGIIETAASKPQQVSRETIAKGGGVL